MINIYNINRDYSNDVIDDDVIDDLKSFLKK